MSEYTRQFHCCIYPSMLYIFICVRRVRPSGSSSNTKETEENLCNSFNVEICVRELIAQKNIYLFFVYLRDEN